MWSVASEVIPLLYFSSVLKFTSSDPGCVTENDNTSDNVIFTFAVWANELLLIIDTVTNAIRNNTFFMFWFYNAFLVFSLSVFGYT